ncbi:microsomal signal peptidase subunit [Tieghemostelium lacteum]|uniref:Signal peptidase complex subunit 3 n=1 Tax=Tieghemostelium lacteum TaxID=361077 RepID=A0A151ZHR3_TIELA|nr:microsomal signal peptidase subunit [Tieghemostelium lacteum]|eukprot:KYQ93394.1 microsomal signal peptidase subunit [Tieghemostelium lacteum]
MYSVTQRANVILCFGGIVLAGVLLLNILSRPFFPNEVTVDLKLSSLPRFNQNTFKGPVEYAQLVVDIQTDLTHLFNWNTKMLFLYITAEYQTDEYQTNEIVIWDYILKEKSDAVINKKQQWEYFVIDPAMSLRNNTVNLRFNYNIIPISGLVTKHKVGSHTFKLPSNYIKA